MGRRGALALRAGFVVAATVGLAVLLTIALAYFTFEGKLIDVATSRLSVAVEEVRRKAEYGLTLGLDLEELQDLQAVIERAAAAPEVEGIAILGQGGKVLFTTSPLASSLVAPAGEGAVRRRIEADHAVLAARLRDNFGQAAGEVVLRASLVELRQAMLPARDDLVAASLALATLASAFALLCAAATVRFTGRTGGAGKGAAARGAPLPLNLILVRLIAVAVVVVLAVTAAVSRVAMNRFEPVFVPELERKAAAVGGTLAAQVNRALDHGVPLDELMGVEALFSETLRTNPDIAYIAVTDTEGRVSAAAGRRVRSGDRRTAAVRADDPEALHPGSIEARVPLTARQATVANLHVGVDEAHLAEVSLDLMLYVMSVLIVSVLPGLGVLVLVFRGVTRRTGPAGAGTANPTEATP